MLDQSAYCSVELLTFEFLLELDALVRRAFKEFRDDLLAALWCPSGGSNANAWSEFRACHAMLVSSERVAFLCRT